jgi:hypothetical protein
MKFKDGYMISSGFPVNEYIDGAVRHVMLRQGVLGIKVIPPLSTFPEILLIIPGMSLFSYVDSWS